MDIQAHPLYAAFYALAGQPRPDGRANIITLTSPYTGCGTSHVARELARLAAAFYAPQGFKVALMDLDLKQQSQAVFFSEPNHQTRFGAMLGPMDITFGETPFWQVSPSVVDENGNRISSAGYGGGYNIGETGLVMSRFDWSKIRGEQQAHIRHVPAYWDRLRSEFAFIIIDTPATDRSSDAIDLFGVSDSCAVVASPVQSGSAAVADLGAMITNRSGQCAGVIINEGPSRTAMPAPSPAGSAY